MREIKFKAWLPGIKKMTYPHTLEELMNWNTKPEDNGKTIWLQWTGLTYNKEEIYEGSIISIACDCDSEFGCSHVGSIHEVVWDNNTAGFALKNLRNGRLYQFDEYGEENINSIGNIYENPELLK